MGCKGRTFQELPPPPWLKMSCKSGLQWAAMGGIFRNYPLTEIAMQEWAARGCNGRTFQELPPDWNWQVKVGCNGRTFQELPRHPERNCHVRVGCTGLRWEDFSGIIPWLKLPGKSGLQWAAMGGLFRKYPSPPDWNSEGVKWCKSWAAKGGKMV